jgi:aminocarboxymuconate-semialdehyde decarboxylase
MRNRRDFLKSVAGTAVGAYAAGRAWPSFAQRGRGAGAAPAGPSPRRELSIGGTRVKVIDIHSHATVEGVADVVKGTPFERQAGGRALGQDRIDLINREGIDLQVLTINGFWWWEVQDRALADRIVRAQNEGLARWVAAHPDRFVAMTSISLQFPDLAAQQLEDGIKRLGLKGTTVGGHVNGESLSDPKFDPFWAKAEELGAVVFMHPGGADNIIKPDAWKARGDIGNIIGNPLETTYFLTRLIFDGTFDKFPRLQVCGAHGGGYLPSYFQRTEVACDVRANAMCANKLRPREYLKRNILADTMVLSDEGLRHLVAEMGVDRIVYGTDNPLNWPVPVDLIADASFLTLAQKQQILNGNLTRLLKL